MRRYNLRAGESGWMPALVAAATLVFVGAASTARAQIELSVNGGTGVPGGSVSVTVSLANDTNNEATSADVDFTFPTDLVEFTPPVTTSCSIAPRLATTHEVLGTVPQPGLLRLFIEVQGMPVVFPPFGDGDLASCVFQILPDAPAGPAPLDITTALLFNGPTTPVPVTPVSGAIQISGSLPATPTVTSTITPTNTPPPATPSSTATATNTSPLPPSATATATATTTNTAAGTPASTPTGTTTNTKATTPTNTPSTPTPTSTAAAPTAPATATATATRTKATGGGSSGGCDIVPIEQSSAAGTLVLLLAPALLVWARRRRI